MSDPGEPGTSGPDGNDLDLGPHTLQRQRGLQEGDLGEGEQRVRRERDAALQADGEDDGRRGQDVLGRIVRAQLGAHPGPTPPDRAAALDPTITMMGTTPAPGQGVYRMQPGGRS